MSSPRRRAFAALLALAAFGTLAIFAVALARFAVLEQRGEQHAALLASARQALASAQAWTAVHAGKLSSDFRPLELAGLLPARGSGTLEVRRATDADGGAVVEGRLTLARGAWRVQLRRYWPLAEPVRPAPVPAPSSSPAPASRLATP